MSRQLLQHISKFTTLDPAQEDLLLQQVRTVSLPKKAFLQKEGQYCNSWYFLEKGCMRMFFVNDKGIEQITQFVIENWWVSDYISYDRRQPSAFSIQAIEPSEVLAIDREQLEQLCRQIPALEHYFRMILQKAYAAAQQRIQYLYDFSREEMYRHFSESFPEFVQRIPQYMLASYLGFTPEYLSELRKKEVLTRRS